MGGMVKHPDGIRRVRIGSARPAIWYAAWLIKEDHCVLLGHTRRTSRHLYHRAYPVSGARGQVFQGWVRAAAWLAEQEIPEFGPPDLPVYGRLLLPD